MQLPFQTTDCLRFLAMKILVLLIIQLNMAHLGFLLVKSASNQILTNMYSFVSFMVKSTKIDIGGDLSACKTKHNPLKSLMRFYPNMLLLPVEKQKNWCCLCSFAYALYFAA